jgi:hypothetical protein
MDASFAVPAARFDAHLDLSARSGRSAVAEGFPTTPGAVCGRIDSGTDPVCAFLVSSEQRVR